MYNNPMQQRYESLMQQKAIIDQQMQNIAQLPPININNQIGAAPVESFDFNGKWIANPNEMNNFYNSTMPMIFLDSEEPIFYIKGTDGTVRKFGFTEIIEPPKIEIEQKVDMLEARINELLDFLTQGKANTLADTKQASQTPYEGEKGI